MTKRPSSRFAHFRGPRRARQRLDRLVSTEGRGSSRRAFLRGAGGVTLGLPFLDLVRARRVLGAPGDHPQRLLILSMGHSMDVDGTYPWPGDDVNLLPTHDAGVMTGFNGVLEPLTPHMSKVNYLWGIDNVVAQALSSNGHNASARTLLSCAPHAGAAFNGDGSLADEQGGNPLEGTYLGASNYPIGESINFALAAQLGGVPLNVQMGGGHERDFYVSQNGNGQPVILLADVENNPQAAFDDLFAGVGTQPSQTPAARLGRKRGSVLDAVLDQFNTLMGEVGADDRERLDRHATHIRQIEQDLDQVVQVVCESPVTNFPPGLPASDDSSARSDDLFFEAELDVVRTAFACQSRQVAHIHFANIQNNQFPFMNGGNDLFPNDGWHAVVHHDNGDSPQQIADRLLSYQWYAQCLSQTIEALEAVPEGNGTLMDNTLIVWVSSLRHSSHNTNNLPVVLAGNLQGQLHTGRFYDFSTHGQGATLGDLWATIGSIISMPTLANGFTNPTFPTFGYNLGTGNNGRPFQNGLLPGLLTSE